MQDDYEGEEVDDDLFLTTDKDLTDEELASYYARDK